MYLNMIKDLAYQQHKTWGSVAWNSLSTTGYVLAMQAVAAGAGVGNGVHLSASTVASIAFGCLYTVGIGDVLQGAVRSGFTLAEAATQWRWAVTTVPTDPRAAEAHGRLAMINKQLAASPADSSLRQ